jgi:hypothetical protein
MTQQNGDCAAAIAVARTLNSSLQMLDLHLNWRNSFRGYLSDTQPLRELILVSIDIGAVGLLVLSPFARSLERSFLLDQNTRFPVVLLSYRYAKLFFFSLLCAR